MQRGRKVALAATTAVLALAVAAGSAYGVLELANVTTTRADSSAQPHSSTLPHSSAQPHSSARADDSSPVEPRAATGKPHKLKPQATIMKPEPEPLFESGDQGTDVRELQSRLKQIAWYSPDITGSYDQVTEQAVRGFQAKRGFDTSGAVDQRTWQRVVVMTAMPTDDEMHNRLTPGPTILGPGDSSPEVRELQARLQQIDWFSPDVTDYYGNTTTAAVSGFQTKREIPSTGEVDQRTMDRLLEMTAEPTQDELHNREPAPVPVAAGAPLDPRCMTGRAMCVDKSSNSLRWVIDGVVQMSVDVRFGSDELPTREGEFSVSYKSIDHVSSLYDTSMPYAMFFSGGQAVHYSRDFVAYGYSGASHGCVNVRDLAAIQSLFDQVDVGDTVVVYWS